MGTGITSFGAYVPLYRLSLATIAQVWGGQILNGEKAVANYDEDSLTMATEAIIDSLANVDRHSIDGLCFATTTPVYREKQNASIIAKAVDLRRGVETFDITNSLRAGTSAMRIAVNTVKAGAARRFIVVASDCRVPAPNSAYEQVLGDGAAAFIIGDSDVAVEIEGEHTVSSDFMDIWRRDEDRYIHTWEDRFVATHGYLEHVKEVVYGLFNKYNMGPKDFAKAVLYACDVRRHREITKKLGFDFSGQVQDPLFDTVGNTGVASAPMMLVAALEKSNPGDRILFVSYGDGADAFILRVTEHIENIRDRRGIRKHLLSKAKLPNYGRYLRFRNLTDREITPQPADYGSLTISWRDRDWVIGGIGEKCRSCGTIQIPPQRLCTFCQSKDDFDKVRISDRKGTVFTYSLDYLTTATPDPPNVIAVIDLDGGGRFYTTMTDRDPDKLAPDMRVELTFRRLHDGQAMHNYFWRARPIRVLGSD